MGIKRTIKKQMDFIATKYPILALTGPRQSGKTTFLKKEFSNYRYVNLENYDNRRFALNDINGFLSQYDKYVIFDEVQRVPELFSYLQSKVDEDNIMGQYILSGSQNFHLMHNITQSLAGRVAIFKLFPFDFDEMQGEGLLHENPYQNLFRGFYPAVYDRDIPVKVFYSNYLQTYVERDLTDLLQVKDLKQFRKFIVLCAARVGQLVNFNSLANECGISQPTAKAWLSVLENSYILYQLQPYYSNLSKREVKTSKFYFYDTGLLCHLLKIQDANALLTHSMKGSLFENFIISELIKRNYHNNLLREFWFWRDAKGHEVDLIWQKNNKLNIIEIKASETIMPEMFKGLSYFEKYFAEDIESKTLVHTGNFNQKRTIADVVSWLNINLGK